MYQSRRNFYCIAFSSFLSELLFLRYQITRASAVAFEQVKNGRKLIFFASSFVKHSPYKGSLHHTHPSFLLHSSLVEAEYRQSDTRGEASGCFASIRKMLCVTCSSIVLIDPRRRLVRLVVELPEEFDAARHRVVKTMTTAAYECFIRTMMKAFVVESRSIMHKSESRVPSLIEAEDFSSACFARQQ